MTEAGIVALRIISTMLLLALLLRKSKLEVPAAIRPGRRTWNAIGRSWPS